MFDYDFGFAKRPGPRTGLVLAAGFSGRFPAGGDAIKAPPLAAGKGVLVQTEGGGLYALSL